ncbi:hypothetical protein [Brevibacillus fulvus]|uniref:dTDP-4-dehydrorhamnose reductase n=1 Tax=Brevibacillus fulvus TaxID=1125967 RepID=A0A938Y2S3_9BACL|nr:hypothetical protein [Brevibacillus fulvus]MBM7592226.1 dTDP-4-dehydrorhamnose reductase [Brevibacillus fulvus]
MATQKRAERSDKKKRIYPYLTDDSHTRLDKLRQAINSQKSVSIHDIAEELLDICTQSPEVISWIQNKYGVPADHPMRVIRVTEMGKSVLRHLYEC